MNAFATRTDFDAWARHRLAEMDAGLAAMEAEVATVRAAVIPASRVSMEQAEIWRNRFADCVQLVGHDPESARFRGIAAALQEAWAQFEAAMENWAAAAEQKSSAFDARAKALLGVWHSTAASYKAQALTVVGRQRDQIEAAIARLERDAARYGEKFEDLKGVGRLSWMMMGEALKQSRAAFERDSDKAEAALAAARKH
ncbi:MAG: hypothetical protein K1X51_06580 [Rhodospirillaceae bacterium]|nr:hypothetical protein [Rhodospirillaceae bacterium]